MVELKSMEDENFSNTACLVYPVEFPSHITPPKVKRPHSTILFLGDIDDDLGGVEVETLLSILSDVDTNYFQYINVTGKALYGPERDYPVLTLEVTPTLDEIYLQAKNTLFHHGIVSPSQWDYSPHLTVDADTYNRNSLPDWVLLRPPVLWYGDEVIEFGSRRRAYKVGRPNDPYPNY